MTGKKDNTDASFWKQAVTTRPFSMFQMSEHFHYKTFTILLQIYSDINKKKKEN